MYSSRHIVKISTPILLSLLAQNMIQVIDTAFLGRVGEVELGASALAGIIYIALYTLGFGFSMGSQILIGRRNGEANYSQIGDIVIQGSIFLLIPALLLIPLLRYGAVAWLPSMFESADVAGAVTEYLEWRVFGLVFAFVNVMFRAFYIGIARTKVLTINAVVMALVNVVFDYGLIFGNLGMPEMGMAGAAIASVIAEFSSTLFFFFYTRKRVDTEKYGFTKIRFQWQVIKRILDISLFMMVQYFFSIGTWMLFFLFIENYMGERSLAVTNIVRSFYTIFTIPSHAIGSTTSTMVSNTIGAGKIEQVTGLIRRLSLISLGVMTAVVIIVSAFPRAMIHIYTDDPTLIEDTVLPLYVLITSLPLFSMGTVLFSAVSGTGNTRTALRFEIVTLLFYVFYMWLIIIHLRASVAVAWTTEHVYWSFLIILSFIYLRSGKWKDRKI
ncbi:MAG: MATE family efflux transporter [Proteiniphilum sp.]|nr:MATE family efflux transporter [Proteiniphilum sp.]MDD2936964.1 MATE family efflux transporter [Proteiniphilum sp.]MDD3075048.1 MATE family efflux transporter [Proteiniphilum sp.]MDD3955369.1 MATE family efflux transporter [Proteiniphilum sp.]MDD4452279.1 MATE family efflux transporter [Proteiniphilum sp.]